MAIFSKENLAKLGETAAKAAVKGLDMAEKGLDSLEKKMADKKVETSTSNDSKQEAEAPKATSDDLSSILNSVGKIAKSGMKEVQKIASEVDVEAIKSKVEETAKNVVSSVEKATGKEDADKDEVLNDFEPEMEEVKVEEPKVKVPVPAMSDDLDGYFEYLKQYEATSSYEQFVVEGLKESVANYQVTGNVSEVSDSFVAELVDATFEGQLSLDIFEVAINTCSKFSKDSLSQVSEENKTVLDDVTLRSLLSSNVKYDTMKSVLEAAGAKGVKQLKAEVETPKITVKKSVKKVSKGTVSKDMKAVADKTPKTTAKKSTAKKAVKKATTKKTVKKTR